jgi:FixJ family two-component response regulator
MPSMMDTLSEREKYVVRNYIAGQETSAAIAAALGISPQKVQQIASKCLSKLRHPSRSEILRVWDSAGLIIEDDYVDVRPGSLGGDDAVTRTDGLS